MLSSTKLSQVSLVICDTGAPIARNVYSPQLSRSVIVRNWPLIMYVWTLVSIALATLYGFATDSSGQLARSIFRDGLTYLNPPVFKIQELYIYSAERDFTKNFSGIQRQMFRIECKDVLLESSAVSGSSVQQKQSSGTGSYASSSQSAAQKVYGSGSVGLTACSATHLAMIAELLRERNPEIYQANSSAQCKSTTEWVLREVLDASPTRLAIVLQQTAI
jgi:hypothetical protein